MLVEKLSAADAAVLETFVVPRYLTLFGDLMFEMLLVGEAARMAHLGCRTGYPDRQLCSLVADASLVGLDASAYALELARNKAATHPEVSIEYREAEQTPFPLDTASCSHVISLHPLGSADDRIDLFTEAARLLYSGGQALFAMPLRGSFQEIGDLLREYSLKYDEGEFGRLADAAMAAHPTIETLSDELEAVGLGDVDVAMRPQSLAFDSGRAFVEDPATRLLILPELKLSMGLDDLDEPIRYIRDAIDKYWSEGRFELTVNVGCASARRYDE